MYGYGSCTGVVYGTGRVPRVLYGYGSCTGTGCVYGYGSSTGSGCVRVRVVYGYGLCTGTDFVRVRLVYGYGSCTGTGRVRVRLVYGYGSCTGTGCVRVRVVYGYGLCSGTSALGCIDHITAVALKPRSELDHACACRNQNTCHASHDNMFSVLGSHLITLSKELCCSCHMHRSHACSWLHHQATVGSVRICCWHAYHRNLYVCSNT